MLRRLREKTIKEGNYTFENFEKILKARVIFIRNKNFGNQIITQINKVNQVVKKNNGFQFYGSGCFILMPLKFNIIAEDDDVITLETKNLIYNIIL